MDGEIIEVPPSKKWIYMIALLPALLFLSAAGAVWFYWHQGRTEVLDERLASLSAELSSSELDSHLEKLTSYVGPRGWTSEPELQGLRRTISYVEGTLSPQNYGFRVHRENDLRLEGDLWPLLWIDQGSDGKDQWLLIRIPYDGDPEDLAVVLAVLNETRDRKFKRGIRFVFSAEDSGIDPESRMPGRAEIMAPAGLDTVITLNGLGRAGIQSLRGDEPISVGANLPAGDLELNLEGEGPPLPRADLLVRARWFRNFLIKAANRP